MPHSIACKASTIERIVHLHISAFMRLVTIPFAIKTLTGEGWIILIHSALALSCFMTKFIVVEATSIERWISLSIRLSYWRSSRPVSLSS